MDEDDYSIDKKNSPIKTDQSKDSRNKSRKRSDSRGSKGDKDIKTGPFSKPSLRNKRD